METKISRRINKSMACLKYTLLYGNVASTVYRPIINDV